MANEAGLVIQGDEEANILKAHADYIDDPEGAYYKIYNVIYGAGGDDQIKVDDDDVLHNVGVALYGEGGNDALRDSEGNDTLSGGIGDDAIYQTTGQDIIDGGEGVDTLYVRYSLNQLAISNVENLVLSKEIMKVSDVDLNVFEDIASGGHTGLRFSFAQQTSYVLDNVNESILSVYILGSAYSDVFDGSMSTAKFDIDGKAGNDALTAGLGQALLQGGLGNDTLRGGNSNDKLWGGSGDDLIYGGAGGDWIEADGGNDTLYGGADNDTFNGKGTQAGDKKLVSGGAGDDTFNHWSPKNMENVVLSGGAGYDAIEISGDISKIGIKGFESLRFIDAITADADVLDQFDRIVGYTNEYAVTLKFSGRGEFTWKSASAVAHGEILGSGKADVIDMRHATQSWEINAGAGNDVVRLGGKAYSSIYGDGGNDILYAGQNGSQLVGGSGNDTLIGGHGNDELDFRFGGTDTLIVGRDSRRDNISAFDTSGPGQDIIDLSAIKAIRNFDDLKNHLSGTGDTFAIDLGGNNRLYIYANGLHDLQESSFIF
jgi:Ca2+-binding RTX toxin-like protein